jgi:hypothetical protein
MKPCTIKPLLAALLLAGSCAAQAAHFEVVSYMGFAGYSGTANGESFSDEAIDASSLLDGDVAFFGANVFSANGIDHAYAADASFFKAGQNFSMSVSQSLTSPFGTTFSADTLVSMPSLKLKIVGDGEAVGSNVSISFAVESTAFNTYALNGGSLTMDFAFTGPDDSTTSALFDFSSESNRVLHPWLHRQSGRRIPAKRQHDEQPERRWLASHQCQRKRSTGRQLHHYRRSGTGTVRHVTGRSWPGCRRRPSSSLTNTGETARADRPVRLFASKGKAVLAMPPRHISAVNRNFWPIFKGRHPDLLTGDSCAQATSPHHPRFHAIRCLAGCAGRHLQLFRDDGFRLADRRKLHWPVQLRR